MAAKIKKGDRVIVIAGRDKGRAGEVIRVMPKENRALVRGVNMVTRHQRQTTAQEGGQLAMPIILILVVSFYLFWPVSRSPSCRARVTRASTRAASTGSASSTSITGTPSRTG